MQNVASGQHQHLHRVIEAGRIRSSRLDDRFQQIDVFTPDFRHQLRLSSVHPVAIASNRVDLAIVPKNAERLAERPGRESVRAIPFVVQADRSLEFGIREISIKFLERHRG